MSSHQQTVSFKANILPLFTKTDIAHMNNEGLDLTDYDTVAGAASVIYQKLTAKTNFMPPPPEGPWPKKNIDLFNEWIQQGTPP